MYMPKLNKSQKIPKEQSNMDNKKTGNLVHTNRRKTKQKHNMCWTPLYANKHKQRKQGMIPPTNS